jgi:hypothetical protein
MRTRICSQPTFRFYVGCTEKDGGGAVPSKPNTTILELQYTLRFLFFSPLKLPVIGFADARCRCHAFFNPARVYTISQL